MPLWMEQVTEKPDLFMKLGPVHRECKNPKQQTINQPSLVFFKDETMKIGI